MLNPTNLLIMFKAAFNKAVKELSIIWTESPLKKLCMEVTTKTGEEAFNWLLHFPVVRKLVGTKVYNKLSEMKYMLSVDEWYTATSISKKDLRRGKLVDVKTIQLGNFKALCFHKEQMISEAILNADTELAYDGVPFFSNPQGKRKTDNLIAGSGVSIDQIKADLKAARKVGRKFYMAEDEEKRSMRLVHNVVICGADLEDTFRTIKNSTTDPSQGNPGVANIAASYISEIIVVPELEGNDWYLISLKIIPPFILLKELIEGKEILHQIDTTKAVSDGILGYSAEQNLSIGYTFPQLAMKIVNA